MKMPQHFRSNAMLTVSLLCSIIQSTAALRIDQHALKQDQGTGINRFQTNVNSSILKDSTERTSSNAKGKENNQKGFNFSWASESLVKTYLPCLDDPQLTTCFKGRSAELLESMDPGFPLNEYVSIVRQPGSPSLTNDAADSLFSKLLTFLASRSLLIKLPDFSQIFDGPEQGRKKKQGHSMYMMMAMMMAGWMMSMKLAALAAIAGKALMASMAALLLAALAALKKHEGSSHHRDYDVISVPASLNHHHHQRSYETDLNDNVEFTTYQPHTYYYRYAPDIQ